MLKSLLAVFFFFPFLIAAAQAPSADSLLQQRSEQVLSYYHGFMGDHAMLYSGRAYFDYGPLEGHAYLGSPGWQVGDVVYDGVLYRNIQLRYDLIKDLLIVRRPDGFTQVALQGRLVSQFSIGNRQLVQLQTTDNRGDSLQSFFQVLASGSLTLLAKKKKTISDQIRNLQIIREVSQKTEFYARKDGAWKEVKNVGALLDLVPERKRELQTYLRKTGIRYRRNPEEALTAITAYYNQTNTRP